MARSSIRYAAGLAFAHLLSVAGVLPIVAALSGHTLGALHPHFSAKYVITAVTVVVLGTFAALTGGVLLIIPSRWFVPGHVSVVFGGSAATGTAVLLSQRPLRPIVAAATTGFEGFVTAPGVLSRLINMWCCLWSR